MTGNALDTLREALTNLRGDYDHCHNCPLGADSVCFPECATEKYGKLALARVAAAIEAARHPEIERVARAARDVYQTKVIEVSEGAQKRWGDLGAALARLE